MCGRSVPEAAGSGWQNCIGWSRDVLRITFIDQEIPVIENAVPERIVAVVDLSLSHAVGWAGVLLIVLAGHAQCVVAVVNRLHALPLPCPLLRRVRQAHNLLMAAAPALLVWFAASHGPALIGAGGSQWSTLGWGWWSYFAVCAVGAAGLLVAAGRYALRRLPALQTSNHSTIVDITEECGRLPLREGPHAWMARLPGNDAFRVEVAEKTYRLPTLPAECDGLSVLHLSDLHFGGPIEPIFFERITELALSLEPHLVVFSGDLLDDMRCVEWLPRTLGRLQAPLGCYFVLGNHDWYLDPATIRQHLTDLGWHDVAGRHVELSWQGRRLIVSGTEVPWMGEHPDLTGIPTDEAFHILVSHTPDHIRWAQAHGVDVMLAGHVHGGQVVLPLLGPIYVPSIYGTRFAGGAFWEPPTLLHVSRGISGRHPLRWRCRPEVTRLLLRCGESALAPRKR